MAGKASEQSAAAAASVEEQRAAAAASVEEQRAAVAASAVGESLARLTFEHEPGTLTRNLLTLTRHLLTLTRHLLTLTRNLFTLTAYGELQNRHKYVLPLTCSKAGSTIILGFLGDADWRKRRAHLYATCVLGEGAKSVMTRKLDNVVGMVLPFLSDQNSIAEDFGEVEKGKNSQAKFHAVAVAALTVLIQNEQCALCTCALAACMEINFCNTNVQEQAITAVASVAKVIGDKFLRIYDIFSPLAKEERFVNDAKEIREMLVRVQSSEELEVPEVHALTLRSCADSAVSDVVADDVEEDGQTADDKDTMTLEIRGVGKKSQVMIPLIDFEYVEDIRIVNSLAMANLLKFAVAGTLNHGAPVAL
ncbi:hypothetical protein PHYSODRAFT_348660 [Phytophthora sojae]|uniref:Uncharacterized protein n=1 Tax=Phytophthora sojae (strain P6497) TaxID=1094619 RepID=G5AHM6_PHYSP|nr:hypothetical protein PHYSODRAFT_348660 [Phytophthora sojae]EGZ04947.1 hypothetical protein PHYSODRAFT_348660 [Phytophthora sojae]|eukprot:XP_009539577.1 hypothetical protein PHYSODRAFT_348660 [Phytophthora sojae]